MPETLGILVTSDSSFHHLLGLAKAAARRSVKVMIFFTGRGVLSIRHPRFAELGPLAEMSICRVSMVNSGLNPGRSIPGIPRERVSNQSRHARLVERCDRYITL